MYRASAEPQLRYARHFGLLAVAALAVAAASHAGLWPRIVFAFAWFGALHAASLAMSLRSMPEAWRAIGFVAAAAIVSASVADLGLHAAPLLGGRDAGLLVVATCAFVGAVGYGLLLRRVLRYELPSGSLAMISAACALAVRAAAEIARHQPASAGFWLAICWWIAFSASLRLADGRHERS